MPRRASRAPTSRVKPSRWAPLASVAVGLCCLGVIPLAAALGALGLAFLGADAVLIPLLVLFLAAALWSLRRDADRHGRRGPERLAWVASLLSVAGLWLSGAVAGAGLALLIGAAVWNIRVSRALDSRCR